MVRITTHLFRIEKGLTHLTDGLNLILCLSGNAPVEAPSSEKKEKKDKKKRSREEDGEESKKEKKSKKSKKEE